MSQPRPQDSVPRDIEGRIAVSLLAAWIASAAVPGALGQPLVPESQLPLIIALGIITIVAVVGAVAFFVRPDETSVRLVRIALLAGQFGLGVAAVGVVSFLVLPEDAEQRQTVLGLSLLALLALAFAFSIGFGRVLGGFGPEESTPSRSTPPSRPPGGGSAPPVGSLVLILAIIGIAIAGFAGFFLLLGQDIDEPLRTVILLVAGFVAVTLLLYLGSVAFHLLGLSNRNEALGLPEGSIRALIAMSLILMFAIIGISVFQAGQASETFVSEGVPADQLSRFDGSDVLRLVRVPATEEGAVDTFDVTVRSTMPDASHDFGLQLLTTVSTLVVAVSGFYFGSRAVNAAADATRPEDGHGSLRVVSPESGGKLSKTGDTWDPANIVLNVSPPFVDLSTDIDGDADGRIERTGAGQYRYVPGNTPGDVVLLTFTMAKPYSASERIVFTKTT